MAIGLISVDEYRRLIEIETSRFVVKSLLKEGSM